MNWPNIHVPTVLDKDDRLVVERAVLYAVLGLIAVLWIAMTAGLAIRVFLIAAFGI